MMNSPGVKGFISYIRDAWLIIGATIVLLILGHYLLGASDCIKDALSGSSQEIDPRADSPVYDNFPDKVKFWKESSATWETRFEPYSHWRRTAYPGEYISIDAQGMRLTVKGAVSANAVKVFMFGGSTLWGTGSPDEYTIPSLLQHILGNEYDLYNFGEWGYVSAQEINSLLYQLSVGNIPDIVIFYDGVNDGYAGAYSPAIPRDPQGLRESERIRREQNWLLGFVEKIYSVSYYKRLMAYLGRKISADASVRSGWDLKVENTIERNSIQVLDMYEAHIRQVKALADEYGFEAYFFWQPNLFSLTRGTDSYEQSIIQNASPVWISSQREVYRLAKGRLSNREHEGILFLGNVFDEVDESIYIDWCHIGPNGNQIIAQEIFRHLRAVSKK